MLKAFNTAVTRILKEDNDFTRAVFTLMKERLANLKATGGGEEAWIRGMVPRTPFKTAP